MGKESLLALLAELAVVATLVGNLWDELVTI